MNRLIPCLLGCILASFTFAQTVTKIELAKDNGKGLPGTVVKTLAPNDKPFHCVLRLKPLTSTIVFTAKLTALNAGLGKYKDYQVTTTNVSGIARTDAVDFKFNIQGAWPTGSYKVEVTVNGKVLKDLTFDVK